MRFAISGFRHSHIVSLIGEMRRHPQVEIVAACESHPELCAGILEAAGIRVTHNDFARMLGEVACDAIVLCDVYADRGAQVIAALEAGRHVLTDKPLCTRLEEVRRIRKLTQEKKLAVLVALTLRYLPEWQTARRLVREGAIGQVCSVTIHGQHPLNFRTGRPDWYFEKGCHGGVINDLMCHGIDLMAYITGHPVAEVLAARAWHVEPAEAPFFQDCGQALLRLANDAGVMMEASYKTVRGHASPWAMQFWGTQGSLAADDGGTIILRRAGEPARTVEPRVETPSDCVKDFVAEALRLPEHQPVLSTTESLDATEKALLAQQAADEGETGVSI